MLSSLVLGHSGILFRYGNSFVPLLWRLVCVAWVVKCSGRLVSLCNVSKDTLLYITVLRAPLRQPNAKGMHSSTTLLHSKDVIYRPVTLCIACVCVNRALASAGKTSWFVSFVFFSRPCDLTRLDDGAPGHLILTHMATFETISYMLSSSFIVSTNECMTFVASLKWHAMTLLVIDASIQVSCQSPNETCMRSLYSPSCTIFWIQTEIRSHLRFSPSRTVVICYRHDGKHCDGAIY